MAALHEMAEILEQLEQAPLVVHTAPGMVMDDDQFFQFCSSTGFKLPNRAMRSPDVSWVRNERLEAFSDEEWEKFLPLCPDFVLELRSPSDPLQVVQKKMEEYMRNGARLGWLLDPARKQVHLYRPRARPQVLERPERVSGEPVLKRFALDVRQVWATMARRK